MKSAIEEAAQRYRLEQRTKIVIVTLPGDQFSGCRDLAERLSYEHALPVEFEFNGIMWTVTCPEEKPGAGRDDKPSPC